MSLKTASFNHFWPFLAIFHKFLKPNQIFLINCIIFKGIAKNLISQLDIGEDKTRVGLFVYNNEMYDEFGLDT